jgi:hypothetical protein
MIETAPNVIYIARQRTRQGFVDKVALSRACSILGLNSRKLAISTSVDARMLFDRVRPLYWTWRGRMAARGEFNAYNIRVMASGKAPFGPDGYPLELHHIDELHSHPDRALDPENIREIFKRQHDFQHGNYGFRWSLKRLPQSPWTARLPLNWGEAKNFAYWP